MTRKLAFALMLVLLTTAPIFAQDSATNTALDYTLELHVGGVDSFALDASLSGNLAIDNTGASPAFQLTASGDVLLGNARPIPLNLEMRRVDNTLYLNTGAGGWQSMAWDDLAARGSAAFIPNAMLAYDPLQLLVGDNSAWVAAFTSLPFPAASTQSEPEEVIFADQNAFQRHIAVRLGDVATSVGLGDMLNAAAALGVYPDYEVEPDVLTQLELWLLALGVGSTFTIDQYTDTNGQSLGVTVMLDTEIDPNYNVKAGDIVTANVALQIYNRERDEPITAPDGATAVETFAFPEAPAQFSGDSSASLQMLNEVTETEGAVSAGEPSSIILQMEAGDVYTFTARSTDFELDPTLNIRSADGRLIASNDDHGTQDETLDYLDARLSFIAPESGEYTVEVVGYLDTAGAFTLTTEKVATGAPTTEPMLAMFAGYVDEGGVYEYPLDLQAGDVLTVTARGVGPYFDAGLALLGPDGEAAADSDDSASNTFGLTYWDAQIRNFVATETGTYTVEVSEYSGAAGSFMLSIALRR